jgi:hypothetical protein
VTSAHVSTRAISQSWCGASIGFRCPPVRPETTPPVRTSSCDHFTTLETATPNRPTEPPPRTAPPNRPTEPPHRRPGHRSRPNRRNNRLPKISRIGPRHSKPPLAKHSKANTKIKKGKSHASQSKADPLQVKYSRTCRTKFDTNPQSTKPCSQHVPSRMVWGSDWSLTPLKTHITFDLVATEGRKIDATVAKIAVKKSCDIENVNL